MPAGEFELLSKSVGVPLVAFRLRPRLNEDGKEPHTALPQHCINSSICKVVGTQ